MLRFILAKILFHRTRKWNKKRSKMFDGEKKILYESIDYWIVELGCAQYK